MDYKNIFINGEWVSPISKQRVEVENPANKKIIGSVPACNEEDVKKAVTAAKAAFETWQFTSLSERIELVEKLQVELMSRVDEMSET